jgi:hypothetical protein
MSDNYQRTGTLSFLTQSFSVLSIELIRSWTLESPCPGVSPKTFNFLIPYFLFFIIDLKNNKIRNNEQLIRKL